MNYIDAMRDRCRAGFDSLLGNTKTLSFVDFPDYPNVGDSAIALGALQYFAERAVRVDSVSCIGTLYVPKLRSSEVVYINGGGNIAGFFDGIDRHRNGLSRDLPANVRLVQGPQSIYWANESARVGFINDFLSRKGLAIAVRDKRSSRLLAEQGASPLVMPDSAHMLGKIESPPPSQKYVVLARRDQEAVDSGRAEMHPDWLTDFRRERVASTVRWKYRYLSGVGSWLNPSPSAWKSIASRRLARGVNMLSPGETVVTDRLHAMLIALQMGRSVVAVDNNNQKLSNYASTWFGDVGARLVFAESIEAAVESVR